MTVNNRPDDEDKNSNNNTNQEPLRVAIIGGGITGVILALGLEKRGVDYVVYERNPSFTELGAGIGFSPNAERALGVVDPAVYTAYKKVTPEPTDEVEYFQWVDGRHTNELIARLPIGVDAFQGGRRSEFLDAWSAMIPPRKVRFRKEIETLKERENGKVELRFKDGEAEEADIVIGCDGVRSRVRQVILGEDNPASKATYTHKFCFRSLIPMGKARAVLGEERTQTRFVYNGSDAHGITYPVARGSLLNALFVISDPEPWTHPRHTAAGTKAEIVAAYADWHLAVRGLVSLLPEKLDKWALFDMYENPADRFNAGAVALAGDAAHASGPHLGSGAGFGVEDALVLASILEAADRRLAIARRGQSWGDEERVAICHEALAAYNEVRFERDQWLPGATREAAELFQGRDEEVAKDPSRFLPRVARLYHAIWDNDIDKMVKTAVTVFERRTSQV